MLRSLFSKGGVNSRSRKGKNQLSSTSSSSSDLVVVKRSRPATATALPPPPSGIFAGSSDVDASHGIFTDASITVARDLNIRVDMQDNAPDRIVLNKLPRAEGAGCRSGNHGTCLEGTRKAELRRIEQWEVDYTAAIVCWLSGVAGSGESTIAQTFAERCAAKGRLGASFFCSRDFADRRNIRLIFPTLAYYLALHSLEFRAALIAIVNKSPDVARDSLAVQFEDLIIQPLLLTKIDTTIVIDALDECEDDKPASAVLSVMARRVHEVPFVKFFVTDRPELPIRSGFRLRLLRPHTEVFLLHDVDQLTVNQDIEWYLRTHLLGIGAERGYEDSAVSWPSNEEITAATKKCAGLFIVAFVIVKFVASRRHKPRERLRLISNPDTTVHEGKSGVDVAYDRVFLHGFEDVGSDNLGFFGLLQIVVGSIVLVFNPLSCATLATILGITSEDVWIALDSLHSVFIVPDSNSEPIRVCHKSLADYLTDATRCKDPRFYINPSVLHLELGARSLRLMKTSLKKNICELPRYVMNSDVDDLETRREKYIGSGLEYACKSWAKHLRLASRNGDNVWPIVRLLEDFFGHYMLQWLEVLSIIGDFGCAVYSLHDVTSWLGDVMPSHADLLALVKDSEKFVLRFFDAIKSSATHIYESALPLSPSLSLVRALYEDQMSTDVKLSGIEDSWDTCIRAIQLQGNAGLTTFSHSMSFSHKEDLIAVGGDWMVEIFEAATGQRQATFATSTFVGSLTFSPDDTILVTGSRDGRVRVWDLQTGGLVDVLEGHTDYIRSVVFSPCGTMIATSSDDCTLRIWSVSSLTCQCVLEGHAGRVLTVCWSIAGNEVISGSSDTTIKVWSISAKKCSKTLTIHTRPVCSIARLTFLSDSSSIISGSVDRTVIVFDAQTGHVLHTISTNLGIESVRFLDQNQIICVHHGTLAIRDLAKSADVLTFKFEGYNVVISSDGTRFASILGDVVKIWQTNNTNPTQDMAGHHTDQVWCISFSRDGQLVASGSADTTFKIWNTSTGRCLNTFHGHSRSVHGVSFSPDSTLCGSWGPRDVIRIWNVHTGSLVSTLGQIFGVADMCFSPDGSQLVSVTWLNARLQRVRLWEVATGNCLASMEVEFELRNISIDSDGTSTTLKDGDNMWRWRLSSASTSRHEPGTSNLSSLPMVFIPVHDAEYISSDSSDKPPRPQYHCDRKSSQWIVDKQGRRILSVLPDWPCHFYGTTVVCATPTGRIVIVDLSDVENKILSPQFE